MADNMVCTKAYRKGPFTDVYSVMANWGANHSASSYGHIGADLITLASMLRIPVCMHNVADEKISGQVHGMHSEWIRKDQITGHARLTEHFINKWIYPIGTVKNYRKACYLSTDRID